MLQSIRQAPGPRHRSATHCVTSGEARPSLGFTFSLWNQQLSCRAHGLRHQNTNAFERQSTPTLRNTPATCPDTFLLGQELTGPSLPLCESGLDRRAAASLCLKTVIRTKPDLAHLCEVRIGLSSTATEHNLWGAEGLPKTEGGAEGLARSQVLGATAPLSQFPRTED